MAIKKSELYSSLWQSCDELRGGMDISNRRFQSQQFENLLSDKATVYILGVVTIYNFQYTRDARA